MNDNHKKNNKIANQQYNRVDHDTYGERNGVIGTS